MQQTADPKLLLCPDCCKASFIPADFIREGAEHDRRDLIVSRALSYLGGSLAYSISCDICQRKLWAPCVVYSCGICNNGDFDVCEACWKRGAFCKGVRGSHKLRKRRVDPEYEDRRIMAIGESKIPSATHRMGTRHKLLQAFFCPLCRIVRAATRHWHPVSHLWLDPQEADELLRLGMKNHNAKINISLEWVDFGWNESRGHTQGRYLVPYANDNPVGDPIVLLSESNPFSSITGSRVDPHRASFPLLRSWLRDCEDNHGPVCDGLSRLEMRPVQHFRVIDVHAMCLVQTAINVRFAALSYMWGEQEPLRALKENIKDLEQTNSLRKHYNDIPRTIKDAIQAVSELGEQYLWVDALCIVQNDKAITDHLVGVMDLIYSCAAFTIICGAGSGADAPLPGVQVGSRTPKQDIEEVFPGVKLMVLPELERELASAAYSTRGWTFQEQILSNRRLIFTPSRIYMQCQCRVYREDFCPSKPDVISHLLQGGSDRHTSLNAYLGQRGGRAHGPGGSYERLVQAYQIRQLTKTEDILRAFQGVLNVLESKLGTKFLAGLPKSRLDSSLLWAVRHDSIRRNGFPSFSWLGWTGGVVWPEHETVSHPFLHSAIADDKVWCLNDTYIEWHELEGPGGSGQRRRYVRNGAKLAYSWLSSIFGRLKPYEQARNTIALDRMGRPVRFEWRKNKGKGKGKEDDGKREEADDSDTSLPPSIREDFKSAGLGEETPLMPEQQLQIPDSATPPLLSFMAITTLVRLQKAKVVVKDDANFRYLSLHHPNVVSDEALGFVTATDTFVDKPDVWSTSTFTVVILSRVPQGTGMPLSEPLALISGNGNGGEDDRLMIFGGNPSETQAKLREMLASAYNVMLISREGGCSERIGTGFIRQSALNILDAKWEHVVLV